MALEHTPTPGLAGDSRDNGMLGKREGHMLPEHAGKKKVWRNRMGTGRRADRDIILT